MTFYATQSLLVIIALSKPADLIFLNHLCDKNMYNEIMLLFIVSRDSKITGHPVINVAHGKFGKE